MKLRPAVLLAFALLLALPLATARAADPICLDRSLYIVAHQDDDLLFQSPDLLEDIDAGDCVRVVFVTAGDAGLGETYWHGREEGTRAAYAQMAGVADAWSGSEITVANHTVHVSTLVGEPTISQVYLRLPNGGRAGSGYAATGFVSLPKLWRSAHPEPASLSPISELPALDGSATYTYNGLLATLEALIDEFEPSRISTQDVTTEFGGSDHGDHIVTARMTRIAAASYGAEHLLRSYMDYETMEEPVNVFGALLAAKTQAFQTYAAHDSQLCLPESECENPDPDYDEWLKRQIVVAESAVPGADAGASQSVASGAVVSLDGSASSDPLGHALDYEWKQTAGPAVTLSDPTAASPTFTAPTGPASLAFSLVVSNSEATSQPASVTVSVAAPAEPPPPPEPKRPPRIPSAAIEIVAGRASKHVIPVSGSPSPEVRCEARLPAGVTCRVRANGEVVIRSSRRTESAGFYRARVVAINSAGTADQPLTVIVRPDPRARLSVDLAVPAS